MTSLYSITMGLLLDGKVIVQMLPSVHFIYLWAMYVLVAAAKGALLLLPTINPLLFDIHTNTDKFR